MENLEQKAGGSGWFSRARRAADYVRKQATKPLLYGALATTLFMGACADGGSNPGNGNTSNNNNPGNGGGNVNHPPVAELTVNPTSGESPLTVNFTLNCTDPDDDPVNYNIYVVSGDTDLSQQSLLETQLTFTQSATVGGRCTDSEGAYDEKFVDIVVTEPQTPPEYPPTVDLSGVSPTLTEALSNEGTRTKTIQLPTPVDRNTDDYPVVYTSAVSDNSHVTANNPFLGNDGRWYMDIITDDTVTEQGVYGITLTVQSADGEKRDFSFAGTLENLFEMSGTLEDNESDSPVSSGTIFAYKIPEGGSIFEKVKLDEGTEVGTYVSSNGTGEYIIEVKEPHDKVSLKFFQGSQNNPLSYGRSLIGSDNRSGLNGNKDIQRKLVRVVPLPSVQGLNVNGDDINGDAQDDIDFKKFIGDIQFPLSKWDLENLPEVQILMENDCDGNNGTYFTDKRIPRIIEAINMREAYLGQGYTLSYNIYPDDGTSKQYTCSGGEVVPTDGIIIAPADLKDSRVGDAYAGWNDGDPYLDYAGIRLESVNPDPSWEWGEGTTKLVDHEFNAHGGIISIQRPDHSNVLPKYKTNLGDFYTGDGIPEKVDIKAGLLTNEPTYEPGEFQNFLSLKFSE